ncbi:Crp/Fnr family transcriptional regulator [Hahella aquimaris]|uniref:Crp/Fnr family transcriptional regulator n=1 Tax=Hahella sp. HNIBRBA332 TaxID=3015983 RepID=UPI00273B3DD0|nr:Crp/Fnr family transcriptional regulator [Hahella sp. HNIBRBA332]WLQ11969.1 Crp/Fnr family transcriptional regulator [Hahella sp. HNIBRBA332]
MNQREIEQSFLNFLKQSFHLIDAANLADLDLQGEVRCYRKGDLLIQQGRPAPKLFYFAKGFARYICISPEGKEFTQSFACSPNIAGSTRAMVRNAPALFSIEALGDILCLEFDWSHFSQSLQRHPGLLATYTKMLEALFIGKEERIYGFVQLTAEQRYLNFLEQNPQLSDKIPLQYIASYIGITPVALSRIRKKLRLD